eukprot:scaffold278090_cov28-Prasinocladus_malaysianus.AAC.1
MGLPACRLACGRTRRSRRAHPSIAWASRYASSARSSPWFPAAPSSPRVGLHKAKVRGSKM